MSAYEGSYKVINRDWNQSLPEIYDTFVEAFAAQQAWDAKATVEQIVGDDVDVVWAPDYEEYVCDNIFLLNKDTLFA